jgi:hypothetical protein
MSKTAQWYFTTLAAGALLAAAVIWLTGCGSRSHISSPAVEGDNMIRVLETGGDAKAGWKGVLGGGGEIGSCRVESSKECIPGLHVEYSGEKCSATYDTPEHCPLTE